MQRKTVIVLTVACALAFFFLAPVIPVSLVLVGPWVCHSSCPASWEEPIVSPSFYFFHVGGTIIDHGYLLWYAPGWTCTPIPGGVNEYTCKQNGVWLWQQS